MVLMYIRMKPMDTTLRDEEKRKMKKTQTQNTKEKKEVFYYQFETTYVVVLYHTIDETLAAC
jgi:hypothetical protein